jgi:hypothetical protein
MSSFPEAGDRLVKKSKSIASIGSPGCKTGAAVDNAAIDSDAHTAPVVIKKSRFIKRFLFGGIHETRRYEGITANEARSLDLVLVRAVPEWFSIAILRSHLTWLC